MNEGHLINSMQDEADESINEPVTHAEVILYDQIFIVSVRYRMLEKVAHG
jgi:hypothetical protein